jgi:hypothetical protein
MKTKTIAEIEEEMYLALMAEVPGLQPLVARGLAKTAADRFRELGIAGQKTLTAQQINSLENRRKFPD